MKSRRSFSVLAVCSLAWGVMAISASGAQAGMWMVNGSNVGSGVKLSVNAKIELEGGSVTLLSTSGANAVAITCTAAVSLASVIELEVITGTIDFSGCTTKINGKSEPNCDPINKLIEAGGTVKAVLHEGKGYAKVEGIGGVIADITFDEEFCVALLPLITLNGTGWFEDCNNEFDIEKVTHLYQEAKVPAERLGGLFLGKNKATIDGSANFTLSDEAHKNKKYSGLAE